MLTEMKQQGLFCGLVLEDLEIVIYSNNKSF